MTGSTPLIFTTQDRTLVDIFYFKKKKKEGGLEKPTWDSGFLDDPVLKLFLPGLWCEGALLIKPYL